VDEAPAMRTSTPRTDAPVAPARPLPVAGPDEAVAVLFGLGFVQSRTGWRFGIDALLLARHVAAGPAAPTAGPGDAPRMLEIGTGCGVVSILAASWGFDGPIVAIETQPALADRARRNVAAAGLDGRIALVHADAARLPDDGTRYDRIVANPPFYRQGSGRANPDPERRRARHETTLDMDGLFALAAARLAPEGLASFLYPAARHPDAVAAATRAGLGVAGVTWCGHGPGRTPRVVIVDVVRDPGRPTIVHPPLSMDRDAFEAPGGG